MSVRISSPSDPAQEVSLAALTVAAVLGMGRLFDDNSWVGPLLLNAIVAHGVVAMLRRRGLTLPVAAAATAAAAGLAVTWSTYWTTTAWGVPTGRTWSAAGDDLRSAWALYGEVVAPAPTATGFVVASVLALWVVAYVADWAAFRLDLPVEALVPAGTLFMFTCLVGAPGGRVGAAALFGSALLAFLLLHRMARQDRASHWVADRGPLGRRSLLGWGVAIGALAVMAGSLVGPTVPGAGSAALLDPRGLGGDGSRVTVSPLIDIRSRLVSQANLEVFTVRSPVHAYWRLTSLDRFDGQIWSSSGTYARARGALSQPETLDAGETFEQTFTIQALSAIWLPAAFQPHVVSTDGVAVRYDEGSSTLIVNNDEPTSDGLVYRVTSVSPRIDVDRLSDDAGAIPADIRERYLPLPDDFSAPVHDLADALTARAAGPAAKARALQDYLRTFDYSLQVQPGHSDSAIEDFLLATKVGYCEQFAGAFAAMARSLGIPARVAVGFTPGQADANDPQLFHVRGEYAHAWPEVYLAGAGWVAYEPTPGRGIPSAEGYTGVPEQQATASDAGGSDLAPTTSEGGAIPSTPSTTAAPGADQATRQDTGQPGAASTTTNLVALTIDPVTRAAPIVAGALLAYLVLFPLGLVLRRVRRRRRASTQPAQIELAWRESVEVAALLGFSEQASQTHQERGRALAATLPGATVAISTLADLRDLAAYTPGGADEADAAAAWDAAETIRESALALAGPADRLRRWFDPRALVGGWRRSHTARQRRITQTARGDLEQERELVGSGDRG